MPTTLYRKYRPQSFAEVVNQQHVRLTLEQALQTNRLAHAYIFTGPRGVGKTTVARLLARAAACLKRGQGSEPCNQCPSCQAMLTNASLDLIEIDAASQTGVDNVRDNVIQSARAAPTLGKVKAFIIDEVHMLSLPAFNALLKLLEEPPGQTLFIMATTEIHKVPATIVSRTQRFDFKPLVQSEIVQRLNWLTQQEKRGLEAGVAERIARTASGSLRDAESILGQLFSFEDKTITAEVADLVLPRSDQATIQSLLSAVVSGRTSEAITIFHKFCQEGGDIPILLHELVEHSRVLMLSAVDPAIVASAAPWAGPEDLQWLLEISRQGTAESFAKVLETWLAAERQLPNVSMEELPVEVAIIKLGQVISPNAPAPKLPRPRSSESPAPAAPRSPTKKSQAPLLLETVKKVWPAIRQELASSVPSIKISLQHAEVLAVDVGEVILRVPFALHAERLQRADAYQSLTGALSEQLGQNLKVSFDTSATPAPPPAAQAKPAKSAATPPASGELWDQVVASF